MKKILTLIAISLLLMACQVSESPENRELPAEGPIQLHPANPHYFLYKGEALALITSAEHYGALLNEDFDYLTYLKTLSEEGMNYTRIFTGSYFEIEAESFGIRHNTLAPAKESIMTPWSMLVLGNTGEWKYDLSSWNEAYFKRLHDFMIAAAELDIIVEVTLFSSIYRDEHWDICPQNPANNINLDGDLSRFDAHTLQNGELLSYQVSFVQKMVQELNEYDHFFFEIQNEPWSDHAVPVYNIVNKEDLRIGDWTYKADFADEASMAWQEHLASVIAEEETGLARKHLIAQNYSNFRASIPEVSDHISIINFHYAWPEAVEWNYHYDRVIGFDETGFAGSGDQVYRRQAWQFMLSGGGLFNNLDYSFFVANENGLGENQAPGGGSKALRSQLRVLSEFLHGFELEQLRPDLFSVTSSPGLIPYVLSDQKGSYAVYLRATGTDHTSLEMETGHGDFRVLMLNPLTGSYSAPLSFSAVEGRINLDIEIPAGELAIKITKE
ncbi:MAG: hypothetical protein P1P86_13880 [Bacteroidales bacterium]|nr:hypothetical protein [Bacteroidales bacterium]